MSEFLADESRSIVITPNGPWIPATASYTETKSGKNKTTGKKILLDKIDWTMSGCQFPPNVFISGSGSISSTCQKVKMEGKKPMRVNDEGQCNGSFQPPFVIPPPPPPVSCNCKFKIISGSVNKVKGE